MISVEIGRCLRRFGVRRMVSFGILVVFQICMSMAFRIGAKVAGIIYGNGMRRLWPLCLSMSRSFMASGLLERACWCSAVSRALPACQYGGILVIPRPFSQKEGVDGRVQRPKGQKSSATSAYISVSTQRAPFAILPGRLEPASTRVDPRLVVFPAIASPGKYHLSQAGRGADTCSGAVLGVL